MKQWQRRFNKGVKIVKEFAWVLTCTDPAQGGVRVAIEKGPGWICNLVDPKAIDDRVMSWLAHFGWWSLNPFLLHTHHCSTCLCSICWNCNLGTSLFTSICWCGLYQPHSSVLPLVLHPVITILFKNPYSPFQIPLAIFRTWLWGWVVS